MVLENVVGTDVPDGLHGVRLAADVDLVTLHGFMDGGAHIADANVDSRGLNCKC